MDINTINKLVKKFKTNNISIESELRNLNNKGSLLKPKQLIELITECNKYNNPFDRFKNIPRLFVDYIDNNFPENIIYLANVNDLSIDIVRKFILYDFLNYKEVINDLSLKGFQPDSVNSFGFDHYISNDFEDELQNIISTKYFSFTVQIELFRTMFVDEIFKEKIKKLNNENKIKSLIKSLYKISGLKALKIPYVFAITEHNLTWNKIFNESIQEKPSSIQRYNQQAENWLMYFVIEELNKQDYKFTYNDLSPFFKPLKKDLDKNKIRVKYNSCKNKIKKHSKEELLSRFKINQSMIKDVIYLIKINIPPTKEYIPGPKISVGESLKFYKDQIDIIFKNIKHMKEGKEIEISKKKEIIG